MTSIRKTLIEIQESQSFERLEPFKQAAAWSSLVPEERELLARLFTIQGLRQLEQGNSQVLDSFELAVKISSNPIDMLYHQGTIFATHGSNPRCLHLAHQAFSAVLAQEPSSFKAHVAIGAILTEMGEFEKEPAFFMDAQKYFEQAEILLDSSEKEKRGKAFYWKWGLCLAQLGKLTGEPFDFHAAREKYLLAQALGCHEKKTPLSHAITKKRDLFTISYHRISL